MLLTEEEAKTKRCQESYPACVDVRLNGAQHMSSWRYPPPHGGGGEAVNTAPLNCIGSACMAWRWGEKPHKIHDEVPLEDTGLSVRAWNCLKNAGVRTAGDVRQKTEAELLRLPNFGRSSAAEVRKVFASREDHSCKGYCGKAGNPVTASPPVPL